MKISVNKYTLEPRTVDGGTAGSHGIEKLSFDFSPEWNGLYRTVTFFPPKSVAKCVSFTGDAVPLPPEVTARAGKTAYVLCGAKDGSAIITLSGVIEVTETLLPTESETEEHTPGALEQATLLCAEARADAQTAADAAQSALGAEAAVTKLASEVQRARNVISDLYDDVMDGVAVHADITEANSADRTHAPSVAGVTERLDTLLSVLSPFRVKVVEDLPKDYRDDCIYLCDGKAMVFSSMPEEVTVYRWTPTYIEGNGPAYIFTLSDQITEGDMLYWYNTEAPAVFSELMEYAPVTDITENGMVTMYGTVHLTFTDGCFVETDNVTPAWHEVSLGDDLTPFLQENPARWLITGGAA